jgi:hypothetical protein
LSIFCIVPCQSDFLNEIVRLITVTLLMPDTPKSGSVVDGVGEDDEPLEGLSLIRRDTLASLSWMENPYSIARTACINSKTYWLLAFVPLAICSGFFSWVSVLITGLNIAAIIPLSALVSHSSDILSNSVGEVLGGLVSATFGNVVELSVRV